MLSGIKFIPRDQLETHDSEEEGKNSTKKEKRDRKKMKDKRSRKRGYSSDSDSGSDSLESESEDERSNKKRKGRRKERTLEDSSDSEDYDKRKRGKKKDRKESSDDDDRIISRSEKELARKEMGLEWMLGSGRSLTTNAVKNDSKQEEPLVEEVKKTNPRELNPYFKDNESGYPDDASPAMAGAGQMLSSSVVGDGGASWRLKALKRAKEQAARDGRKLDEVVEERWGSLGQLAVSVSAQRAAPSHAHLHAIKDRKKGQLENSESAAGGEMTGDTKEVQHAPRGYLRDVSSRHLEMRKPKQDSLNWKKNRKTNISQEDSSLISAAISGINKFTNDGSFMESISCLQNKDANVCNSSHARKEENDVVEIDTGPSRARNTDEVRLVNKQGLSANQLAAKVLQLRMKGRHEEAEQLSKEMEAMIDKPDKDNKMSGQETERNTRRYIEKQISSERKKREEDADLHLAQTIMRNKQYSMTGRADDEYDYDGDVPSRKRNRKKEGMHERRNIPKSILTQQERCQFCFENPTRPKHLVVAIGNFTYMMLPQWQPVVQGHCCILPMQHDASTRVVDKNVSEELRNFKKCLLRMFAAHDKDVVFIETVIGLSKQRRHCLIECIPIPYAIAKQAPMYFKKAIDEAEDEWGQHEMKKVIPTSGNLRNVIPDNFAYFHVEFGLDKGFVHVIDNDSNFPSSFGLNIVRGMLRLPEEDMHRRRQHEPIEKQKQDVARFAKEWEPFDWTKDLD